MRFFLREKSRGRRVFRSVALGDQSCEGGPARAAGACGSKNVGTSNRNLAENARRRKIKVSLVMSISQGLAGPKGMAKAAPDGQEVNIPPLLYFVTE